MVLKFISSRDEESSQLVRAISTLLEFSPQEEKYVKEYLEYKVSLAALKLFPNVYVIVAKHAM